MNEIPIFIAMLPETTQNVSRFLTECNLVITMMTDNQNFPAPAPPLSEVSTSLDTLKEREELALKGGMGMVKQRNVALRKARNCMNLLTAYVQTTANEQPDQAEAIIESAGMKVGKQRSRTKLPLEARHGDAIGRVVLDAKALPKPVQYRWQMSTDQEIWTDLPETFKTKTVVDGLVPATVYAFRLRTVTKNGPSEWSSPITIIAH